jgi:secreted trypsin-like serine protease
LLLFQSMGGVNAPEYAYPWIVLLMSTIECANGNKKAIQDRCTGFIANDRLIVTAAHCLYSNYTDELVRCEAPQQKIAQQNKIIW